MVDFTAKKENKEKRMKRNEDSLRDLWDNIKRTNIHIIRVPEGEEREEVTKIKTEMNEIENKKTIEKSTKMTKMILIKKKSAEGLLSSNIL